MAHRTEHIYSNLIRTLNRLHAPREPRSELNDLSEPQESQIAFAVSATQAVPETVVVPAAPPEQESGEHAANVNVSGLSYIGAILAAKDGERVCRMDWSKGIYIFVEDGVRIMKCTEGGHLPNKAVVGKFTPIVTDVLANDWMVFSRQNCTFLEAMVAMEKGQHARRSSWTTSIQIKEGKFFSLDDSQQEYTVHYEDIRTPDWEIMHNLVK